MHPKRLQGRILKAVNRAVGDYSLIGPGDKILVALSGGKDSFGMLWALRHLKAAAPFTFDLVLFHLDQAQPGHDTTPIAEFMAETGLEHEIERQDTYARVIELTKPGKTYCSVCSRFRRAILYRAASRHGCNKVALGHHRDDLIETLVLSIFFSGQIKSMPAKLRSQKGDHLLIRPMCYVHEEELRELAELHGYPVTTCGTCGNQDTQRSYIKTMLGELSGEFPSLKGNILHSLTNVQTTHLLDKDLNPLLASGDSPSSAP